MTNLRAWYTWASLGVRRLTSRAASPKFLAEGVGRCNACSSKTAGLVSLAVFFYVLTLQQLGAALDGLDLRERRRNAAERRRRHRSTVSEVIHGRVGTVRSLRKFSVAEASLNQGAPKGCDVDAYPSAPRGPDDCSQTGNSPFELFPKT